MATALSVAAFAADTEAESADLNGIRLGDNNSVWWGGSHRLGSIFGDGSLTAIIILGAIVIVAGVACFIVVKKKKSNKTKNE